MLYWEQVFQAVKHYVHHIPGRLRLRTPVLKGNQGAAGEVERRVNTLHGVRSVSANAVTGSVLVHYDHHALTLEQIMAHLPAVATPVVQYAPVSRAIAPYRSRRRHEPRLAGHLAKMVLAIFVRAAVERAAFALVAAVL